MTDLSSHEPSPEQVPSGQTDQTAAPCSLNEFLLYFLRLGTFGFGGPIALAGYMQRDLVERRRGVTKEDYTEGLALAQLAPGPLAAQLAMYLGWVRAGVGGHPREHRLHLAVLSHGDGPVSRLCSFLSGVAARCARVCVGRAFG